MGTFFQKLYVRIWLAVVLAVAVLTLLVGWAWRMTAEPPLREVVVRNATGEVIGNGSMRGARRPEGETEPDAGGRFGRGPEFLVRMHDGQTVHMHMPRPPGTTWRAPLGFFWTLGLVAVAVLYMSFTRGK